MLLTLLTSVIGIAIHAQLCPANIDFEAGNFSNWTCNTGSVAAIGSENVVTWTATGAVPGRHTIIPANSGTLDTYGGFPQSCPNGSGFSIQLGNNSTGAQAEGLSYTFTIPLTATYFSIIYYYAVVFQDPAHLTWEQPRFRAKVTNVTDGDLTLGCQTFDFTASATLPGFVQSHVANDVFFKDWTPVTLDLSGFAGKTIRLEFTTSDCTRGGHFGYAYIDVNAACNAPIVGSTICQGETVVNLVAPFGFEKYEWWSDPSFTTSLGNSATLHLDPLPAVGSIFPVVVTPFTGFGCKDTIYAVITTSPKPPSVAGPDKPVCKGTTVQLGAPSTIGYSYTWSPPGLLDNPAAANPTASVFTPDPVEFRVKTTDLLTGCFSFDTVVITPVLVDTAMTVTGKDKYCIGEPLSTTFTTTNTASTLQWYQDGNPIPGATGNTYQPLTGATYYVRMSQTGCLDSSRKIFFMINPKPVVAFTASRDTQCVKNSFTLTDGSSIPSAESLSYLWKFSDGTTQASKDAIKTFDVAGDYDIELVVTSFNGCKDSIPKRIKIMPNAEPDFVWDSICTKRPATFTNQTNENGSVQTTYHWDFKNSTVSDLKDPPSMIFDTPGIYDILLQATTLGCEMDPKSITKPVWVNLADSGIRYHTITMAEGYNDYIKARDTIGNIYNWQPPVQLNNYTIKRPYFTATDDVEYIIEITNPHTCVTVDTLQLLILKKPGVYLPTAFTPNNDGLNDVIKPYLVGLKQLKKFSIYNRNGNLLFATTTDGIGWDGTYQGLRLDSGVFVWIVEYITTDNKPKVEKGTITLVR